MLMTFYAPDNPNRALVSRPRKHPVRQGIRAALVVLVSILLVCSLTLTLGIAAVRTVVTPEYVYRFADRIDYADFPLPVDGEFVTISELMMDAFNRVGFNLRGDDIDILFDQFSIPVILAGFAQDFTGWFLQNGSRPVLNPDEIAAIALSGVDSSIMTILNFLGDPTALLSDMLVRPLSTIDLDNLLDRLEPVRAVFSADAFALLASVTLFLAVLLFCLCGCRLLPFCLPAGIACFLSSVLVGVSGFVINLKIPQFTRVYAAYLAGFLSPVVTFLWRACLIGLIIGVLLFTVWLLSRILRQKNR